MLANEVIRCPVCHNKFVMVGRCGRAVERRGRYVRMVHSSYLYCGEASCRQVRGPISHSITAAVAGWKALIEREKEKFAILRREYLAKSQS